MVELERSKALESSDSSTTIAPKSRLPGEGAAKPTTTIGAPTSRRATMRGAVAGIARALGATAATATLGQRAGKCRQRFVQSRSGLTDRAEG